MRMTILAIALLFGSSQLADPDLDAERRRATPATKTIYSLITIIATYDDGTPVYPGTIGCSGYWFKYIDEQTIVFEEGLPFSTDARGAIILNPFSNIDTLTCVARSPDGRSTVVEFAIRHAAVLTLTIP